MQVEHTVMTVMMAVFTLTAIATAIAVGTEAQWRPPRTQHPGESILISAPNGAVAAERQMCSEMGVDTLKAGGNAVDAAITTALCIGATNLFSSGIGGGGFMLVYNQSDAACFDFREEAPGAAHETMFAKRPELAQVGGLAVAVPGELAGLEAAWRAHGRLPWARVLAPVVNMTRDGFPVGIELAERLHWPMFADMIREPGWGDLLAPEGKILEHNDIMYRRNLSQTLEAVAQRGAYDAFYTGRVAEALVHTVQSAGGVMTANDLAAYRVISTPAIRSRYRGHDVFTCGAPTSGPVLVEALNVLDGYDLAALDKGTRAHLVIEAMKHMAAARTELGDPAYVDNAARVHELMTTEWAEQVRANISLNHTKPWWDYNPHYDLPTNHGTTHLTVVDAEGMAVSLTSTVNLLFGSQVLDAETGVVLNDEMDDFSTPNTPNAFGLRPSPFNYPQPGKRPLSSSTPTVLVDGDGVVELALGGSGGSRIVTAVLDAIVKLIDVGVPLDQAIRGPRLHHQLLPDAVTVEDSLDAETVEGLEARGHDLNLIPHWLPMSEVQAILRAENQSLLAYVRRSV